MNEKERADHHHRNTKKYLRDTENRYVISLGTGLYEPNSPQIDKCSKEEPADQVRDERPKPTWAEITSAIFSGLGILISFCTLIGVIFTVFFTMKQWNEARRTADASIVQAGASEDSVAQSRINNAAEIRQYEKSRRDADAAAQSALKSTIDNFHAEQRPWVGIKQFTCEECSEEGMVFLIKKGVSIRFENTGRTPAVDVTIDPHMTRGRVSDPIPTLDSLRAMGAHNISPEIKKSMDAITRFRLPQPFVIAPGAWSDQTLLQSARFERSNTIPMQDTVVYLIGSITYKGTDRKQTYTTIYCLFNELGSEFHYCASGNDMQ